MTLQQYITIQCVLQSNGYQDESEALAELFPDLDKKWQELTEQAEAEFCEGMAECYDIFRKR